MFVIYHSSDSFASVTGVAMLSLFENNQHMDEIEVLYIERGITNENKARLMTIAERYGRILKFMPMPNWSEKFNLKLQSCKNAWLGFGYNRLFLLEYIPLRINRVLYLDSDTIVEGPLDELWSIDLTGYYLAGVDDCLSSKYRKIVGLCDEGTYCNAGMLLINLNEWRESRITPIFINKIQECNGYFVFNEQSILNSIFAGKIKILPQKYNMNSLYYVFDYEELLMLRRPYSFSYDKIEYYNARIYPVITHYTGLFCVNSRPWIIDSDHPHKDVFLKYREMSPWKGIPLSSNNRKWHSKILVKITHILPKQIMIKLVSILYNDIRPLTFQRKLKREREDLMKGC
ncbi:glycosyltransferase family 8 protein [Robinsoniella peoriensis]|uniref:glycosyltransferase family 8 protein n=1 Tax=Robinsoniella peoriensis TaxID=180332 RepID=UPI0005C7D670|nr:glycosyltransferase family 8 protein [Robinsoniella peoriensis]